MKVYFFPFYNCGNIKIYWALLRFAYSVDGGTTWVHRGSNQANPSAWCVAGSTLSGSTTFATATA